jgi:MFS family permease
MARRTDTHRRTEGLRRMVAVATTAPFSWYLAGQAADAVALWMQRLALGWLVWELTGSAAWLGAISFLKFAPTMLLGLFGGVLADRFPRGGLVVAGQAVTVASALGVAVLVGTGAISMPLLVVLTLMVGIAVGLTQAASKAVVNELVPRADIPAAIALNSVVFNVSQLVGPALAGLMLVFAGMVACFAAVAALFAANLVVFLLLLPRLSAPPQGSGQPMLGAIATAVAFCARHDGIAPLLALHFVFTFAARPVVDLIPAFAGGALSDGVDAVSLLTSAVGLGAVATGTYLAARPNRPGLVRLVMRAMLVLGLAIGGFAVAPDLYTATAMATLIGAGMAVRAAGVQTLVQLAASDDLRGRVLSLYGLGLNAGAALGGLAVGALADAIGLREAIAATAALALGALALAARRGARMEAALEREDTR